MMDDYEFFYFGYWMSFKVDFKDYHMKWQVFNEGFCGFLSNNDRDYVKFSIFFNLCLKGFGMIFEG